MDQYSIEELVVGELVIVYTKSGASQERAYVLKNPHIWDLEGRLFVIGTSQYQGGPKEGVEAFVALDDVSAVMQFPTEASYLQAAAASQGRG